MYACYATEWSIFRFKKLDVWICAVELSDRVYDITRGFPDDEKFGFANQLRRASASISSNIVEGSGRNSGREFVCFVLIAYGSLMEFVSQCKIAERRKYISLDTYDAIYCDCERVAKILSGLRTSLAKNYK
jgi:four helix bundle protein